MSYQGYADFRSDTVTRPTQEMRRAMAAAEVGDDVLGDDPTVHRLEELAAGILAKEAALFVPSGTMGNTIALIVHNSRGKEVLLEEKCHIYQYEAGNVAHLVGALPRTFPSQLGRIPLVDLEASIKDDSDPHQAASGGIALENTHNYHGGTTLAVDYLRQVGEFARRRHLFLHLDGARIFNAATAMKIDAAAIAQPCDSVMFCLSKGLAAPIGSMLVGNRDFIARARRVRKQLGGGLRQAGILAAAGIIALDTMRLRLADDHRRAQHLAAGLAGIKGLAIEPSDIQTNIVILRVVSKRIGPEELVQRMATAGVLALTFGPGRVSLVTHNDIDDADVEKALLAISAIVSVAGQF
jgi:threonine aldolase